MPGGAPVDPGCARPAGLPDVAVDGDMRGDRPVAQRVHEAGHVISLVGAERDPPPLAAARQHGQRRLPLGGAGSPGQRGVDDQRVAVLHQQMAHVAQPARLALGLAMKPGIGVGDRGMGRVGAPLAAEVALGVAPGRRVIVPAAPRPEALHRRPSLDRRAVDREVLVRQQSAYPRAAQNRLKEARRHIARNQTVPVLRIDRRVPHRRVHRQPDEPAEQKVVVQLLHPRHECPARRMRGSAERSLAPPIAIASGAAHSSPLFDRHRLLALAATRLRSRP